MQNRLRNYHLHLKFTYYNHQQTSSVTSHAPAPALNVDVV